MSRPFRFTAISLTALTIAFTGCRTSTPYTAMYSPRPSHYQAPPDKKEKSAEELLKATETKPTTDTAPATGLPPGEPSAIPGLPPAAAPTVPPAADPLAPPPAQ